MITPEILSDIWDCAAQAHGEALNNLDRYRGIPAYEKKHQGEVDTAQRVLQWCKDNDTTGQFDWWPRKESYMTLNHVRIDKEGYEQIVREFARHYDNPFAWSFEERSTLALGMRNLLAGGTSPGGPSIEIDATSWQDTADEMADKRRASDAANVHWWQWNVENCKVLE